eukprot:1153316-Pelagomonas_calceolata.AAC.5
MCHKRLKNNRATPPAFGHLRACTLHILSHRAQRGPPVPMPRASFAGNCETSKKLLDLADCAYVHTIAEGMQFFRGHATLRRSHRLPIAAALLYRAHLPQCPLPLLLHTHTTLQGTHRAYRAHLPQCPLPLLLHTHTTLQGTHRVYRAHLPVPSPTAAAAPP